MQEIDNDAGTLKCVEYHGSVLLQKLVQMTGGVQASISGGLVAMSPAELHFLATNGCGCHILEAMLKSSAVTTRVKDNLCRRMKVM